MIKLRLMHIARRHFGSKTTHHFWVGQQWDAFNELWEDQTNEYLTAQQAELNLLRSIAEDHGFIFEPTFEL